MTRAAIEWAIYGALAVPVAIFAWLVVVVALSLGEV